MKLANHLVASLAVLLVAGGMLALPVSKAAAAEKMSTHGTYYVYLTVENASKFPATVKFDGHVYDTVNSKTTEDFRFPDDGPHSLQVYVNGHLFVDHSYNYGTANRHFTCFINASTK